MLVRYLFLVLLANVPLAIGQYPATGLSQGLTCNCNCNFPKSATYLDPYGQQTVVCIPVPITVQGMYPRGPVHMPPDIPSDTRSPGISRDVGRHGNMASPGPPSIPPEDGSVPGGFGPAPSQPQPDVSGKPAAESHSMSATREPASSTGSHPGGSRIVATGSETTVGEGPPKITKVPYVPFTLAPMQM